MYIYIDLKHKIVLKFVSSKLLRRRNQNVVVFFYAPFSFPSYFTFFFVFLFLKKKSTFDRVARIRDLQTSLILSKFQTFIVPISFFRFFRFFLSLFFFYASFFRCCCSFFFSNERRSDKNGFSHARKITNDILETLFSPLFNPLIYYIKYTQHRRIFIIIEESKNYFSLRGNIKLDKYIGNILLL